MVIVVTDAAMLPCNEISFWQEDFTLGLSDFISDC